MDAQTNTKVPIDRTRLCKLADVSRGKHIRWTQQRLLVAKQEYSELDMIRAAILDELHLAVKPSLAKSAWLQVETSIEVLKPKLQILIAPATDRAHAIHDSIELEELLPRGELVIVVSLQERVDAARERLREFRANNTRGRQGPGDEPVNVVRLESAG